MKLKTLFSLTIASALVFACSSDNTKKTKAASEIEEVSVDQIVEDIENIPTPTSFELMTMINKAGIGYMFDVTNSLSNRENYLSTKQKALNLGVYAADLSYDVAYMKKAETEEYLKCILEMATDLNISVNVDKISAQFQNNIDNLDSLSIIVRDLFKESQYILNQTSQVETALFFLIGSWIESSYICVTVAEGAEKASDFASVALGHFDYATTILKYLEGQKEKSDFAYFYEQLTNVQAAVAELNADKTNAEKRDALTNIIVSLRNSII